MGKSNQVALVCDINVTQIFNHNNDQKSIESGVIFISAEEGEIISLFDAKVSTRDDMFWNSALINSKKSALCIESAYLNT